MNTPNAKPREPVRGIVFDKDGTLLDFTPTWLPAYKAGALFAAGGDAEIAQRMLTGTGLDEESGHFVHGSLLASGTTDQIAVAWQTYGARHDTKALIKELDTIFADVTAHSSVPFPGLLDMITELSGRDIVLGLATNDSEVSAHAFLDSMQIGGFFSFVAGYDSGHGGKPSPGMVDAFCRVHDLPPMSVMVVGDNHCDLEMGRQAEAGLVVGVLSGNGRRDELEPLADILISGIDELLALDFGR